MSVVIYIKGKKIDLYYSQGYSLTKQVNEFSELKTRQWNYTNKHKVPKTTNNKKIFDFLSSAGNTSDIAYVRIEGAQMQFNGVPIITNGYAEVKDTGTDYNLVMYDGSVRFFEAIKELTLKDLDWSDIDHLYNEQTMELSWANTEGYIYPVTNVIENQYFGFAYVDMPAPSVYFKTIMDKIEAISGVKIEGSMLSDETYLKTVMTTKKSIKLPLDNFSQSYTDTKYHYPRTETNYNEANPPFVDCPSGYYRIQIVWEYTTDTGTVPGINIEVEGLPRTRIGLLETQGETELYAYGKDISAVLNTTNSQGIQMDIMLTLNVDRIDMGSQNVFFADLMPETNLATWLKNVMVMFGANLYPTEKGDTIYLDYINDLDDAEVVDISKYYQSENKEQYQFGGYASNNTFRYTLEDGQEEEGGAELQYAHNRGETKVHFTSIFNEPLLVNKDYGKHNTLMFSEDGSPDDNSSFIAATIITVEQQMQLTILNGFFGKLFTSYAAFDFDPLKFGALLPKYYKFVSNRIFNAPVKKTITLALPLVRFYLLDFKKLYYFSQYNADFMINKIKSNNQGVTTAEMIKVNKRRIVISDPVAVITGKKLYTKHINAEVNLHGRDSFSFEGYITAYAWEVKDDSGAVILTSTLEEITFTLPQDLTYEVCLTVTNEFNRTNTICEEIVSSPIVVIGPSFGKRRLIESVTCHSLFEFIVLGDDNGVFNLRIQITKTNGESELLAYEVSTPGQNCINNGCPTVGAIDGNGFIDTSILLDAEGRGWIQFRVEGARHPGSTIANETTVIARDLDKNVSEVMFKRQWNKLGIC